jgi:hypothetical protein
MASTFRLVLTNNNPPNFTIKGKNKVDDPVFGRKQTM